MLQDTELPCACNVMLATAEAMTTNPSMQPGRGGMISSGRRSEITTVPEQSESGRKMFDSTPFNGRAEAKTPTMMKSMKINDFSADGLQDMPLSVPLSLVVDNLVDRPASDTWNDVHNDNDKLERYSVPNRPTSRIDLSSIISPSPGTVSPGNMSPRRGGPLFTKGWARMAPPTQHEENANVSMCMRYWECMRLCVKI